MARPGSGSRAYDGGSRSRGVVTFSRRHRGEPVLSSAGPGLGSAVGAPEQSASGRCAGSESRSSHGSAGAPGRAAPRLARPPRCRQAPGASSSGASSAAARTMPRRPRPLCHLRAQVPPPPSPRPSRSHRPRSRTWERPGPNAPARENRPRPPWTTDYPSASSRARWVSQSPPPTPGPH